MSFFGEYPVKGGGGGVTTYANLAAFPSASSAGNGALAIALDTNILYESNGTSWLAIAQPGDALTLGAFGSSPNANGLSLSAAGVLNMQPADATHPGALSSTDWNTFNDKQPAGNYITALTGDGSASGPGSAALTLATVNTNVGAFSPAAITVNAKGLVTAASSLATGNLSDAGTDGIVITSGTGAVLGSGTSIAQHVADTTHNGYLSSADWNTFNGKQAAGNYITSLTGDGTAAGPGSAALTLATVNANVGSFTYASITVNGKGLITAVSSGTAPLTNPMTTLGDIIYEDATPVPARLAGNITSTKKFLTQTGTGSVSAVPAWSTLSSADLPAGTGTVTSVTFTGDGTVLSSTPSSAVTTSGTLTAALANASANTYLGGPLTGSAAAPAYRKFTPPTRTNLTSTGSTAGYIFTISTSTTCAVGDTYTNNSNTYTVVSALSAQSGQVMVMSGASAPTASGTLTRSAGAGTSSVTFSAATALAAYTTPTSPAAPVALNLQMIAGGGGGGCSGTASGTAATNGGQTIFAGNGVLLITNGGGAGDRTGGPGSGGTATVSGANVTALGFTGTAGAPGINEGASPTTGCPGTTGAGTRFGGGGQGPVSGGSTGGNAAANTGAGGAGASGTAATNQEAGSSGGAGAFIDALIAPASLATTYYYTIGAAGSGQVAGTAAGGNGGTGVAFIQESYQ